MHRPREGALTGGVILSLLAMACQTAPPATAQASFEHPSFEQAWGAEPASAVQPVATTQAAPVARAVRP